MTRGAASPDRCAPSLALERALHGELEGSSSAPWQEHIAHCVSCQARLETLRQEGARYDQSPEARALSVLVAEREQEQRGRRERRRLVLPWTGALAAAAAAGAAVFLHLSHPTPSHAPRYPALGQGAPADVWQTKGGAILAATVIRQGVARAWQGQPLAQGDVIELAWTCDHPGYLGVWLRDDRGEMERVAPEQGAQAQAVAAGHGLPIGPGLQVQGDTRDSTVWVVFSRQPFALGPFEHRVSIGTLKASRGTEPLVLRLDLRIAEARP